MTRAAGKATSGGSIKATKYLEEIARNRAINLRAIRSRRIDKPTTSLRWQLIRELYEAGFMPAEIAEAINRERTSILCALGLTARSKAKQEKKKNG